MGERIQVGDDTKCRTEHATDLAAIGMYLDDRHAPRHVEQRVALRHRIAEAGADRQDQVGFLHLAHQPRIGPDAEIAGEIVHRAVIQRLTPEPDRDRHVIAEQEITDRRSSFLGPARTAKYRQRLARSAQHGAEPCECGGIGMRHCDRRARQVRHLDHILLHLFG